MTEESVKIPSDNATASKYDFISLYCVSQKNNSIQIQPSQRGMQLGSQRPQDGPESQNRITHAQGVYSEFACYIGLDYYFEFYFFFFFFWWGEGCGGSGYFGAIGHLQVFFYFLFTIKTDYCFGSINILGILRGVDNHVIYNW